MPIYHQPSGEAHVHPRECGNRCIHVLGKDAIAGFVVDPIARTCECIGDSTNDRDPLALHNRAQIAFTVGSTVMYKAFWCEGAEPDLTTDGAYVYSHRVGSQTWCPGRVPDHMGESVISGTVYTVNEDIAEMCRASCDPTEGCNLVQLIGTSWSDVAGAPLTRPSPPPTPPVPPQPPPPLQPPLPPLLPVATGQERFRKTWHPDGYEFPTQDGDLLYSLTCGAETCDGKRHFPVFPRHLFGGHDACQRAAQCRAF